MLCSHKLAHVVLILRVEFRKVAAECLAEVRQTLFRRPPGIDQFHVLTQLAGLLLHQVAEQGPALGVSQQRLPDGRALVAEPVVAPDLDQRDEGVVVVQHPCQCAEALRIGGQTRMSIQGIATDETEKERVEVVAQVYAAQRNDKFMADLVARISVEPDVKSVSWAKVAG